MWEIIVAAISDIESDPTLLNVMIMTAAELGDRFCRPVIPVGQVNAANQNLTHSRYFQV
jgi:hypothetical protein